MSSVVSIALDMGNMLLNDLHFYNHIRLRSRFGAHRRTRSFGLIARLNASGCVVPQHRRSAQHRHRGVSDTAGQGQ